MHTSDQTTTRAASAESPIFDPAGYEGPVTVKFEPAGETEGEAYPAAIFVDSLDSTMGLEQASQVARRILELVDEHTPASLEAILPVKLALMTINGQRGTAHTLESVCASLGLEVGGMTMADVSTIAKHVGGELVARPAS